MKYIMKFIEKFTQKALPTPLGRWNLDYCSKKINDKIELSNEDHCGSCGQYAISKNESTQKNISTDFYKNTNKQCK
jgi:hypothetical protein